MVRNAISTPIRLSPAMIPDETGIVYLWWTLGLALLSQSAMHEPMKNETELNPLIVNASPSPVGDGMNFLYLGSQVSSSVSTMPLTAPIMSPMRADGLSACTPFASSSATPRHT